MQRYNSPASRSEYQKWKRHVKKRDGYKCQWALCSCKTKLQVHHILEWSKFPHLRYAVNNGITLCKQHHTMIKGNEPSYAALFTNIVIEKNKKCQHKKK